MHSFGYIPRSGIAGSFGSSPTFVIGGVFDDSYSNRSEMECSVVLICISFMARDGKHFFMWSFGHLDFFL
jgi:hypothetical protein